MTDRPLGPSAGQLVPFAGPFTAPFAGAAPRVAADAWVAPNATLIGDVDLAGLASVWFGAVLRADADLITVGSGSNIQDGCVLHTDAGLPLVVGADVTVGHRAVLHGCRVEDGALVGMGAILLNGSRVGAGTLVAAGSVVLDGVEIPPGVLAAGAPARVKRSLTEEETRRLQSNAQHYRELAAAYRRAEQAG